MYLKVIDMQWATWRKDGWQVSDDAVYLLGRQLAMVAPSAVAIEVLQHGAQLACGVFEGLLATFRSFWA